MLQEPEPVLVVERFPDLLDDLVDLLTHLKPEGWARPTAAPGWSVKDMALHLLGDDIGLLSNRRDGFRHAQVSFDTWDELVDWLNQRNEDWVGATRRISPRLLCDFLRLTGSQVNAYLSTLDLFAYGGPVSWAGPEPAPVWLDVAREFTERWHHQQHIREAVGAPGLVQPYYLTPVLATFVYALPRAYQRVEAPDGTCVTLSITGNAGGLWSVVRQAGAWKLFGGAPDHLDTQVTIPQEMAWKLFTRGITTETAREAALLEGDAALAEKILHAVAIIA